MNRTTSDGEKARSAAAGIISNVGVAGNHPLKDLQFSLDEAVRNAYGMSSRSNPLSMLMNLNEILATSELKGQQIVGPGLPKIEGLETNLVSSDCLRPQ